MRSKEKKSEDIHETLTFIGIESLQGDGSLIGDGPDGQYSFHVLLGNFN